MSDNSHIDKIFRDGLGEMNLSNTDAMWQRMDAELDRDDKRKKRPVIYFIALAGLLVAAGLFSVKYFTTPAAVDNEEKIAVVDKIPSNIPSVEENINAGNAATVESKMPVAASSTKKNLPVKVADDVNTDNPVDNLLSISNRKKKSASHTASRTIATTISPDIFTNDNELNELVVNEETNSIALAYENQIEAIGLIEKVTADIDLVSSNELKQSLHSVIPALNKDAIAHNDEKRKKETAKPKKIAIELIAGRDFLRMNRKAGSYIGIRVNRLLDNGTAVTVGVNYATHVVFDSYRLISKPADQKTWDARLNNIASVRVPIFLQRQMGKSKISMMIGLVPTYITHAEVYNVPDSYTGNPDPYRKFTVNDLNRFNVLFGAGLKYAPTKWFAIELSGNYSLTGMVKDGYKNQSRVNDNFKSLQAGFAFRLW